MRRMLWLLVCLLLVCAPAVAEELDLAGHTGGAGEIAQTITDAQDVSAVNLEGVSLTWQERKSLMEQFPDVHFIWTVQVFGVSISSEDTEADFAGARLGKTSELCLALDCLPELEKVYMWKCNLPREDKLLLRQTYPDIFFGWEINMNGAHTLRTDMTAFSTLGKQPLLALFQMPNFTLCPYLKALDIGHCTIRDISFLRDCVPLKVLILADTGLKDITPLESQTEVEYLELFMNKITDISPLAGMTNLKDVNLAFNDITDLSPLYHLPHLERVWLMQNKNLSQEEIDRLREHQPECEIVTRSYGATGNVMIKEEGDRQIPGTSWRDHPRYDTIYYIFNGGTYIDWDEPIPADWKKVK